jgi:hypothetical protein
MENPSRYTNYKDFFPYYLREHSKKNTRILHYIGTGLVKQFFGVPLSLKAGYSFHSHLCVGMPSHGLVIFL